mgnify:CR=1 FL=1
MRRATELAAKEIHYVDCGTSGGIMGLERGYCLMIGGPSAAVKRLDPVFRTLAPGAGDIPRTPGREKLGGTAEHGYLHCGPSGAGHFVKMVQNGIEYGDMQMICETYQMMKEGLGLSNDEMHAALARWNEGVLDSYLVEITRDIPG